MDEKSRARVVSIGCQKGGVSKSTISAITAWLLERAGKKVLLIDCDSQGNGSYLLHRQNIYDFVGNTTLEAILDRGFKPRVVQVSENLHVVPAEDSLSDIEQWIYVGWRDTYPEAYKNSRHLTLLRDALYDVRAEYDFIILDLPPSPGLLTQMGLVASDYAMVVMACDMLCYEAVFRYLGILKSVQSGFNPNLRLLGIVPSLIDSRAGLDEGFLMKAREEYQDFMFDTVLRRNIKIKEFAATGISDKYAGERRALVPYAKLLEEMMVRVGKFEAGKSGIISRAV
jgi:chromosome partitioning protein